MVSISKGKKTNNNCRRLVSYGIVAVGAVLILFVVLQRVFNKLVERRLTHYYRYSFNPVLRHMGLGSDTLFEYLLAGHPNPTTIASVVIEVGCFRLKQSITASNLGFKTLSFDASPKNFAEMEKQFEQLPNDQKSRMQLFQKAVSDKSGQVLQFASIGGTGDHAAGVDLDAGMQKYVNAPNQGIINVETVALDDIVQNQPPDHSVFLLKVDVQGHEASVFRGASKSILNGKIRYILFEYWVDALDQARNRDFGSCTAVRDILIPLVDAGYELFDLSLTAHPKAGKSVTRDYVQRYFRPLNFDEHCNWFASLGASDRQKRNSDADGSAQGYSMGYWTDVLAVYKGSFDLGNDMSTVKGHAPLLSFEELTESHFSRARMKRNHN
mmetsp:Transcript_29301/g.41934  ORF Transcript_29301/g.41934 Transcript_29301/m.41934 type:complete len:382 (-) Transcript_29301:817-1962(-)